MAFQVLFREGTEDFLEHFFERFLRQFACIVHCMEHLIDVSLNELVQAYLHL